MPVITKLQTQILVLSQELQPQLFLCLKRLLWFSCPTLQPHTFFLLAFELTSQRTHQHLVTFHFRFTSVILGLLLCAHILCLCTMPLRRLFSLLYFHVCIHAHCPLWHRGHRGAAFAMDSKWFISFPLFWPPSTSSLEPFQMCSARQPSTFFVWTFLSWFCLISLLSYSCVFVCKDEAGHNPVNRRDASESWYLSSSLCMPVICLFYFLF